MIDVLESDHSTSPFLSWIEGTGCIILEEKLTA